MTKILIADDSRFQVQMLGSCLSRKGFEVVFAYDAMQAWMAALRSSPDLILLDINMPAGTGVEVLKRLRISAKTQHIPVIVISGEQNPATESMVRNLGASDFLHKPVDEDQLCGTIDRVLGIRR
jgi:twitching motility two-component system response regulator PilH